MWFAKEFWVSAYKAGDTLMDQGLNMGNLGSYFAALSVGVDGGVEPDIGWLDQREKILDAFNEAVLLTRPQEKWVTDTVYFAGLAALAERYLNKMGIEASRDE